MIDIKKYKIYESSMIKSIRRGFIDDAVYWASLVYDCGKEKDLWRRIFIHLSEDIGLANTHLPSTIKALYENYLYLKNTEKSPYEDDGAEILPLIHAVMLLADSEKSRAVDNAITVHFKLPKEDRSIPDYAYDFHSPLGKRMGRDLKHFFEVAAYIENEKFDDEWKEKAKFGLLKEEKLK